jgi:hypothetical protein
MNAGLQHQLEHAASILSDVLKRNGDLNQAEEEKLTTIYFSLTRICQGNRKPEPFHHWLDAQKNRKDRIGELARLSAKDKKWPRNGDETLSAFVDRLRLTNLTKEGLHVEGASGADLVEQYLYPAWDEYTDVSKRRQLRMVVGGNHP